MAIDETSGEIISPAPKGREEWKDPTDYGEDNIPAGHYSNDADRYDASVASSKGLKLKGHDKFLPDCERGVSDIRCLRPYLVIPGTGSGRIATHFAQVLTVS